MICSVITCLWQRNLYNDYTAVCAIICIQCNYASLSCDHSLGSRISGLSGRVSLDKIAQKKNSLSFGRIEQHILSSKVIHSQCVSTVVQRKKSHHWVLVQSIAV